MKSIRVKLSLLMLAIVVAFTVGFGVWRRAEKHEHGLTRLQAMRDHQKLLDTLMSLEGRRIQTLAFEYSSEAQMQHFVQHPDTKWGKEHLERALTTFDGSGCWVYNKAGTQIFGAVKDKGYDLKSLPLTPQDINKVMTEGKQSHFFVKTVAGVVEIRGARIHTGSSPAGLLLAGRLWNKTCTDELGRLSGSEITITNTDKTAINTGPNSKTIAVSRPLAGLDGQTIAYVYAVSTNPILHIRERSAVLIGLLMGLYAAAVIGFLSLTLRAWICRPLKDLCTSLEEHDSDLLSHLRDEQSEFGALARLIDRSYDQEQELIKEVCDRKSAQRQLAAMNDDLEHRVQVRTAQLETANESLEGEVEKRSLAEKQITDMNAVLQHRLDRLTALRHIDLAIASTLDLRKMVNICLEHVTNQLGAHASAVLRYHSATQTLHYVSWYGFNGKGPIRVSAPVGEGLAGECARNQAPVLQPNLTKIRGVVKANPALKGEKFIFYLAVPLIVKEEVKGILEVMLREEFTYDQEWLDYLDILSGQLAIAIDNAGLLNDLQRSNQELTKAYQATIEGWSRALDMRDKETQGHSERVTTMTLKIARMVGMGEEELAHVRHGALLHDIGKMGVPDAILLKPGILTDDEWIIMRSHAAKALELLSPIDYLRPALDIPYCHHEKWDGSGYPRGLKAEEIPLAARIFAIADVYDALASERPYRSAWPREKVIQHIVEHAGTHFDPELVEVFSRLMNGAEEPGESSGGNPHLRLEDSASAKPKTSRSKSVEPSDLLRAA